MEIGVYTFGELAPDPTTGRTSPGERIHDLIEEIVLADEVGLDVFGVGEHHRPDFAVSAPAVVLAAAAARNRIARERGFSPLDRDSFDTSRSLRGANFVGSPQEVIDKILFQHGIFGHDRFLLQMIGGGMPHTQVMHSIELLGTVVAPAVRTALGGPRPGR